MQQKHSSRGTNRSNYGTGIRIFGQGEGIATDGFGDGEGRGWCTGECLFHVVADFGEGGGGETRGQLGGCLAVGFHGGHDDVVVPSDVYWIDVRATTRATRRRRSVLMERGCKGGENCFVRRFT